MYIKKYVHFLTCSQPRYRYPWPLAPTIVLGVYCHCKHYYLCNVSHFPQSWGTADTCTPQCYQVIGQYAFLLYQYFVSSKYILKDWLESQHLMKWFFFLRNSFFSFVFFSNYSLIVSIFLKLIHQINLTSSKLLIVFTITLTTIPTDQLNCLNWAKSVKLALTHQDGLCSRMSFASQINVLPDIFHIWTQGCLTLSCALHIGSTWDSLHYIAINMVQISYQNNSLPYNFRPEGILSDGHLVSKTH